MPSLKNDLVGLSLFQAFDMMSDLRIVFFRIEVQCLRLHLLSRQRFYDLSVAHHDCPAADLKDLLKMRTDIEKRKSLFRVMFHKRMDLFEFSLIDQRSDLAHHDQTVIRDDRPEQFHHEPFKRRQFFD